MKRLQFAGVVLGLLLVGFLVCIGTFMLANKYLMSASDADANRCKGRQGASHQIVYRNGIATPHHIQAKLCDTLTITNLDSQERLIAFGPHSNHISYDGVSERLLTQGQSVTVTLIEPGTYLFHDHTDYSLSTTGNFTVTQ